MTTSLYSKAPRALNVANCHLRQLSVPAASTLLMRFLTQHARRRFSVPIRMGTEERPATSRPLPCVLHLLSRGAVAGTPGNVPTASMPATGRILSGRDRGSGAEREFRLLRRSRHGPLQHQTRGSRLSSLDYDDITTLTTLPSRSR